MKLLLKMLTLELFKKYFFGKYTEHFQLGEIYFILFYIQKHTFI